MDRTQLLGLTIGRAPNSGIVLDDPSVSQRHAMLSVEDGRLVLTDVGSSNGTFVNGRRVEGQIVVSPGDRVVCGSALLPWGHHALSPLLGAVNRMSDGPTPTSTADTQPVDVWESEAADSSADDPLPALPVHRGFGGLLIGGGALVAMVSVCIGVGGVAAAVYWLTNRSEPAVASRGAPPPTATAASTDAEPIDLATAPQAANLFVERLADQIDVRRQQERVEETRFRLRSQVNVDGFLFFNGARRPRESWAVPLGVVERAGRQMLAVGTTRCVVDYDYPFERVERDRGNFRNLAMFTGDGRQPEVFRISDPPNLRGSRIWNGREGLLGHNDAFRHRYFQVLARTPQYGVHAQLVEGNWSDNSGVDFVILYFPVDDPGASALDPRPTRTLQMRDPEARMADALGGRTSLWGDTFQFSMVSRECMDDTAATIEANDRRHRMLQVFAIATAVVLVGVITGGAATAAFAALKGAVSRALVTRVGQAAVGAIWRTVVRTVSGENLRQVLWSEGGRLVLHFLRPGGEVAQTAIGGFTRAGLSPESASRVVAAVRSLIERSGEFSVPTVRRPAQGEEFGAIMNADRRIDVAAELVRRGLVQLDTSNEEYLRQQPTLVRAAQHALLDGQPAGSPIADPGYRARVQQLSVSLGGI